MADLEVLVGSLVKQIGELCQFPLEISHGRVSHSPPCRGYPQWVIEEVYRVRKGRIFSKEVVERRLIFWIEEDVDGQRYMKAGIADRRVKDRILAELASFKERHNLIRVDVINPP